MNFDTMVGARIRRAREAVLLSLDELAHLVEVCGHYLGQVEAGHERPEPKLIIRLAKKTGVSISYFLDPFH